MPRYVLEIREPDGSTTKEAAMRRALESEHIDYVDDARPDLRVVVEGDCSTSLPSSENDDRLVAHVRCVKEKEVESHAVRRAVFAWAVAERVRPLRGAPTTNRASAVAARFDRT
jgi:hypothetical protein